MGQWGKGLRAIVHSFSSRTRPLECVSLFFTHLSPGDSKHLRGRFVLTGTVSGLELFCFYFKAQCLASLWGKGRRDLTSVSFPFHLPVFFLPPLPASRLAALSVAFSPYFPSFSFLSQWQPSLFLFTCLFWEHLLCQVLLGTINTNNKVGSVFLH